MASSLDAYSLVENCSCIASYLEYLLIKDKCFVLFMNLQLNAIYCYENICILHVACVIMFNYDHGDWLRSSENTIFLYINPIKHCHTIVWFLIVILCVDGYIGMYLSCFTGLDD